MIRNRESVRNLDLRVQVHPGELWISNQCTEMRFASFLSGAFITALVVNPPESKLAKRTSVQWVNILPEASKSAGAKGDVPKICGFVHPLHPL